VVERAGLVSPAATMGSIRVAPPIERIGRFADLVRPKAIAPTLRRFARRTLASSHSQRR
jgi:hypothetical protein